MTRLARVSALVNSAPGVATDVLALVVGAASTSTDKLAFRTKLQRAAAAGDFDFLFAAVEPLHEPTSFPVVLRRAGERDG